MRWGRRPRLSVVVVVHRMPDQALRTLRTLSPAYQRGVSDGDLEVVVVENESDRCLDAATVAASGPAVRYLRRAEPSASPAAAVNAGIAAAAADAVAVMVDGARMLTPGVVSATLAALRAADLPVVCVPGYHLGGQLQYEAARTGYDEAAETALLARAGWPADGYALFDVAVLSGSCARGFLVPMGESNFLAAPRRLWEDLGGVDERFTSPGGGCVNLDLYKRACEHPGTTLVVLPGEGTFHQFHGGVTTGAPDVDRNALFAAMDAEYRAIRGAAHTYPVTRPLLFGAVGPAAAPFLEHSVRELRLAGAHR